MHNIETNTEIGLYSMYKKPRALSISGLKQSPKLLPYTPDLSNPSFRGALAPKRLFRRKVTSGMDISFQGRLRA